MIDHERVSKLFLRASDLTPEEASNFLDIECGDDAELRAELEAMLAHDAREGATGALAARVRDAVVSAVAGSGAPMPQRIGPYRIIERLGEGGMGVVYRAEQIEPIRREVALKVIRGGADSTGVVARFEAERQMLASMDHPNIAKIFDAGSDAEGRPYFVMELIDGVPITDYCQARNLQLRDRLTLFVDVCRGVRHAHRRGVIHRDLKPSNVLVTDAGGAAAPKVIDFSVAKALGASSLVTEFRTRTGQVVGTLEYMSPEQAMGRVDAVDTRSDVYALGVVLYELIANRLPQDLRGLSLHDAVKQIADEPPRALRGTKTTAMGRVNADLETIVRKCLEKDQDRRYGSAAELTDDLERYLDSRPILARPPSTTYQLRKLVLRHRVAFGVAALVIVFLVIFSITVSVDLAVQRRERARADAQARKADRVAQFMGDSFGTAIQQKGRDVTVMAALEGSLQRASQETTGDFEADAEVLLVLAHTYNFIGDGATAERLNREAVSLLERHFGPRHPAVATASQALGVVLYYRGRLDEASTMARRVLEIHEAQHPRNAREIADDLSLLGSIEKQRRHLDAAEAAFRREITVREAQYALIVKHNLVNVLLLSGRIGEATRVMDEALALHFGEGDAAMLDFDVASLKCAQGKHVEAEGLFRRAVDRENKLHGLSARLLVGHGRCLGHLRRFAEAESVLRSANAIQQTASRGLPLDARASGELATLFLKQHRPGEAEPFAHEALETERKAFGDDHFAVGAAWSRVGAAAEARSDWKAAEAAYRRSLTLREAALAGDDLEIGYAVCDLARFLSHRERFQEAAPLHARGIAILVKRFDVPVPALSEAKGDWALTLDGLERYGEGQQARDEALGLARSTVGDADPLVARLLRDQADSFRRQRRLDEALTVARDAVARHRQALGSDDADLADSLLTLAQVHADRGQPVEARTAAREALAIWATAEFVDPAILASARQLVRQRSASSG